MMKASLLLNLAVVATTLAHAQDFLPYQTIVPPTNDTALFGRRVAVSGTSLAIAELEHPRRVFVYEKNEATGTFEQNSILTNPNIRLHATFYGISLNLQNGILVVGDTRDRIGLRGYLGSVFVYRQNPVSGRYRLLQTLRDRNGDRYGSRVAFSNDGLTIAVGVYDADFGQGAVYVYTRNDRRRLFGAKQKVVTHEWRSPTFSNWFFFVMGWSSPWDDGFGLGYTLAVQNGLLVAADAHFFSHTVFAFERSAADGLFRERSPGPLEECGGACNFTYFKGDVVLTDSNEVLLRRRPYRGHYSVYASLGPLPLERLQKVADKGTFIATGGGYLVICDTEGVHECNVFRKNVQTALWEARGTLVLAGEGDCQVNVGSLSMDEEKTVVVGTYCPSDTLHDAVLVYDLP